MQSDLRALIERLEKLEGPDRQLDDAILAYSYGTKPIGFFLPGSKIDKEMPRLTASLDAAIALCERVLPGRGYGFLPGWTKDGAFAGVICADSGPVDLLAATIAPGPTPALALLLATLKALESQGPEISR